MGTRITPNTDTFQAVIFLAKFKSAVFYRYYRYDTGEEKSR